VPALLVIIITSIIIIIRTLEVIFNEMPYINLRFTYLLTYLLLSLKQIEG